MTTKWQTAAINKPVDDGVELVSMTRHKGSSYMLLAKLRITADDSTNEHYARFDLGRKLLIDIPPGLSEGQRNRISKHIWELLQNTSLNWTQP